MTWKPPESVRIGPSQRMNLCSPPRLRDPLGAGAQHQVIGVAEQDVGAGGLHLLGVSALTVPAVPTGMKAGVRMSPRGVAISPRRARAVLRSQLNRNVGTRSCIVAS